MLKDKEWHPDGSVTMTIRRLTRKIDVGGTSQTLVSFDGETWVLEKHEAKEALRLKRACNLQGEGWVEEKKKEFDARMNPGERKAPDPDFFRPYGSSRGKKRGKWLKSRRNAKGPKNYLNVVEQNGVKLIGPPLQGGLPGQGKRS